MASSIRASVRVKLRKSRAAYCMRQQAERRKHRREPDYFDAVVNGLCNWARHQWARAGYPGLRERDTQKVFAAMIGNPAERLVPRYGTT